MNKPNFDHKEFLQAREALNDAIELAVAGIDYSKITTVTLKLTIAADRTPGSERFEIDPIRYRVLSESKEKVYDMSNKTQAFDVIDDDLGIRVIDAQMDLDDMLRDVFRNKEEET